MNPQALYKEAVLLHQQGRLAAAEPLYLQILATAPDNFPTRYMFALLRHQQQRTPEALEAITTALALNPRAPDALVLQGALLEKSGQLPEALAAFNAAAAIKPTDPAIWSSRGALLQALERQDEALASYEKLLALKPDHAEAWYQRGVLLQGFARLGEALASYDRCVALAPTHAKAWSNRGTALRDLKRPEEALASLDRALAAGPEHAVIWHNRGTVFRDLRRLDDALESYDRALALNPDLVPSLNNRSDILWLKRLYDPAVRDLERLLQLDPDYPYAQGLLLHLKMQGADWQGFDAQVAAVNDAVRAGKPVVQPFVYQAISTVPQDLQSCSVHYANRLYPPLAPLPLNGNRGHRKIRLGYMSGEMRSQAIGFLMVGVFEQHDRAKFELVILDNGWSDGGPTRLRIEAAAGKLIDITRMTNAEAAARIRDEEIDILINLNGYFGMVRMEIFAAHPAPIQVNYLGLPATLGAPYMDYIIADRTVIPDAETRFYTESVAHLAQTYWPTDNRQAIAAASPGRAACGLPAQGFVFCNFNQSYKLTPAMFAVWMRILKQVDGSVLWLLDTFDAFAKNLRREAEAHGIAAGRLIFAPAVDLDQHLARIKLADLSLDGIPYNAHTTACDVLWAGVPLVTCPGTTFPGRVAASLLNAIGMPELICEDMDAYEKLAVALARDPARLAALREKLAHNRLATPLFDTPRFTRNLEAAYTRMWETWLRQERPRGFSL